MSFQEERRRTEWERLRALAARCRGLMSVQASSDLNEFYIQLRGIPAPVGIREDDFTVAEEHNITIFLPPDFPDVMPVVAFERPIFHPNEWEDGTFCHGEQWYPARHLDELIIDVVHDIQLWTPDSFNLDSPANLAAHRYYLQHLDEVRSRLRPVAFPPGNGNIRRLSTDSRPRSGIRVTSQGMPEPATNGSIRVIRSES